MRMRTPVTAALVAAFALLPATAASARDFAPLDRPGPGIGAKASLSCTDDVANAKVQPVLLNPATGVTVAQTRVAMGHDLPAFAQAEVSEPAASNAAF